MIRHAIDAARFAVASRTRSSTAAGGGTAGGEAFAPGWTPCLSNTCPTLAIGLLKAAAATSSRASPRRCEWRTPRSDSASPESDGDSPVEPADLALDEAADSVPSASKSSSEYASVWIDVSGDGISETLEDPGDVLLEPPPVDPPGTPTPFFLGGGGGSGSATITGAGGGAIGGGAVAGAQATRTTRAGRSTASRRGYPRGR